MNGAQSVALGLAAGLGSRVVLAAPVRTIEHGDGKVRVRTDAGEWTASRAIVAVPPALAGRIAYDPPLPAMRDELTQRYPMGATIKLHALYDRAFWRDEGYSGEAVYGDGPIAFAVRQHVGRRRAPRAPRVLGRGRGAPARGA